MKQALSRLSLGLSFGVFLCVLGVGPLVYTCSQPSTISTETLHRHVVNLPSGTGVVIADGWVLTAKHVAVTMGDAERFDHPDLDVSAVKWDTGGKTAVEVATQSPGVGVRVFLVGFVMGRSEVITEGLSGKMPSDPEMGTGSYESGPGLSGGAVLNEAGELVGIHVGVMLHPGPGWDVVRSAPEALYVRVESFQEWLETLVVVGF